MADLRPLASLRPLERLRSIKLKFGIVIVVAVFVTLGVNEIGLRLNFKPPFRAAVAALLALALVQLIGRGTTRPLRDMEGAARDIAAGRFDQRVATTSLDEVGRLAASFNHMAAELELIERMRRDLVANVSHELRTPLSSLRANLENLVDGVAAPEPELLGTMLEQVERLQRLVSALLDLARLEAGSSPLHHDRVELPALLERVADEARLQAGAPTIEVHAPAGLTVPGDGERLHQVVANLVDNAVRYSPANGRVAIEAMPAAGSIEVRVTDEGPGIPEDERARVFERFYRSDRARTNAGGGAGLGLAIAHWIVDLHGGTIRAEAAQPTGCCVVIALPNEPATPVA